MPVEIINQPFNVTLYGYSGKVLNRNYPGTGGPLMDAMWKEVKSKGIKNKGINYWVYEKDDMLFTGVELDQEPPPGINMELKKISLPKYAYYKHTGPYSKLKEAYSNMDNELEKRNIKSYLPFLEIYGHWNEDETKLETEILYAL